MTESEHHFIDFTNFRDHPERKGYVVFRYYKLEQGDYFEGLMKEANIWYEKFVDDDEHRSKDIVLFGVKKQDFARAQHLNNIAIGKYRSPFIPYKGLRLVMIAFFFVIMGLAVAGYLFSR